MIPHAPAGQKSWPRPWSPMCLMCLMRAPPAPKLHVQFPKAERTDQRRFPAVPSGGGKQQPQLRTGRAGRLPRKSGRGAAGKGDLRGEESPKAPRRKRPAAAAASQAAPPGPSSRNAAAKCSRPPAASLSPRWGTYRRVEVSLFRRIPVSADGMLSRAWEASEAGQREASAGPGGDALAGAKAQTGERRPSPPARPPACPPCLPPGPTPAARRALQRERRAQCAAAPARVRTDVRARSTGLRRLCAPWAH